MKKLFALLLALCLMLCACAYAEETNEINWADVEEKAAQIEGQFAPPPSSEAWKCLTSRRLPA